jgi:hypothetical protein
MGFFVSDATTIFPSNYVKFSKMIREIKPKKQKKRKEKEK